MTDHQINLLRQAGFFDRVFGTTNLVSELLNRGFEVSVEWSKGCDFVYCRVRPEHETNPAKTALGVSSRNAPEALLYAVLEGIVNRLWQ